MLTRLPLTMAVSIAICTLLLPMGAGAGDLVLRLDANNLPTGALSSWEDSYVAGRGVEQTTTSYQPTVTFDSSGVDFNGRKVVQFNGNSSDYLENDSVSYTAQTVLTVFKVDTALRDTGDLGQIWGQYAADGTAGAIHVATDFRTGAEQLNAYSFDGGGTSSAKYALDGGSLSTSYYTNDNTYAPWTGNKVHLLNAEFNAAKNLTQHYISTLKPNTGHFFGGQIAEILVFSDTLTSDERTGLEHLMGQRWGVTGPASATQAQIDAANAMFPGNSYLTGHGMIMYDGFPTDGALGYVSDGLQNQGASEASLISADNKSVVHPSMEGFQSSSAWGGNTSTWKVYSTGLEHPALRGERDGAAIFDYTTQISPPNRAVEREFNGAVSEEYFAAGLMQFQKDVLGNVTTGFVQLAEDSTVTSHEVTSLDGQGGIRYGIELDGNEVDAYIEYFDGTDVVHMVLADNIAADTPHLWVVKLEDDAGTGEDDLLTVWFDPTDLGSEPTDSSRKLFQVATRALPDDGGRLIDHLGMWGYYDHPATLLIDEVRWGDRLFDVANLPEPSTFLLSAFGLLGLTFVGRRRRKR